MKHDFKFKIMMAREVESILGDWNTKGIYAELPNEIGRKAYEGHKESEAIVKDFFFKQFKLLFKWYLISLMDEKM